MNALVVGRFHLKMAVLVNTNRIALVKPCVMSRAGEAMHIYAHPALKYPIRLQPGMAIEHRYRPGTLLVITAGPEKGVRGEIYRVRTPEGRVVPVLRENLKFLMEG